MTAAGADALQATLAEMRAIVEEGSARMARRTAPEVGPIGGLA